MFTLALLSSKKLGLSLVDIPLQIGDLWASEELSGSLENLMAFVASVRRKREVRKQPYDCCLWESTRTLTGALRQSAKAPECLDKTFVVDGLTCLGLGRDGRGHSGNAFHGVLLSVEDFKLMLSCVSEP